MPSTERPVAHLAVSAGALGGPGETRRTSADLSSGSVIARRTDGAQADPACRAATSITVHSGKPSLEAHWHALDDLAMSGSTAPAITITYPGMADMEQWSV